MSIAISELTEAVEGRRIKVTKVAPSDAEEAGYCNDSKRLLNQTGVAVRFKGGYFSQLEVEWDDDPPGSLSLAGADEIEVL